jgi:hypothetical protein
MKSTSETWGNDIRTFGIHIIGIPEEEERREEKKYLKKYLLKSAKGTQRNFKECW